MDRLAFTLRIPPHAGSWRRSPGARRFGGETAVTFLIFVVAFVMLACLGLPLVVLGIFAALCREKAERRSLEKVGEAAGGGGGADRFPGRWV